MSSVLPRTTSSIIGHIANRPSIPDAPPPPPAKVSHPSFTFLEFVQQSHMKKHLMQFVKVLDSNKVVGVVWNISSAAILALLF